MLRPRWFYLAEFLLSKKYIVHAVKRKSSSLNTDRIDHIYDKNNNFKLHYGDLTDPISVNQLINSIKPNEIYNLAAQSHVAVSFKIPQYTALVDAIGCLNILESIKSLKLTKKTKFYQAGTSEMFGKVLQKPTKQKKHLLSKKSLRSFKGFCSLDDNKLQRIIWNICV